MARQKPTSSGTRRSKSSRGEPARMGRAKATNNRAAKDKRLISGRLKGHARGESERVIGFDIKVKIVAVAFESTVSTKIFECIQRARNVNRNHSVLIAFEIPWKELLAGRDSRLFGRNSLPARNRRPRRLALPGASERPALNQGAR